jgi:hypothetical protein
MDLPRTATVKRGSVKPLKMTQSDNRRMMLMTLLEVEEARIKNLDEGNIVDPTPKK